MEPTPRLKVAPRRVFADLDAVKAFFDGAGKSESQTPGCVVPVMQGPLL